MVDIQPKIGQTIPTIQKNSDCLIWDYIGVEMIDTKFKVTKA